MSLKFLLAAMMAVPAACQPAANPVALEQSAAGLDQVPLTIASGGKSHNFTVEVARTLEQQQTGMMNRNSLGPDRTPPDCAELQAFCRARLAPYKVPRRFEFVAEFPRTSAGKIQKHLL